MDEAAIVALFLEQFRLDSTSGQSRDLAEYQSSFLGYEGVIAREFEEISTLFEAAAKSEARAENGDQSRWIGRYRIVSCLARGGQGDVYLAEDSKLHRMVALKVLRGLGAFSENLIRRFQREAEVMARLAHPGICPVHEAATVDGISYIAMQYVPGGSLAAEIAQARSTAAEAGNATVPDAAHIHRAVALVRKVALALHAAHDAGIVHRDVKPGNILVAPGDDAVIVDFGLAADLTDEAESLSRTTDLFGTPAYLSPEQLAVGRNRTDRRTDVWSLGVTLYECLTLQRPFEGATREALYQAIQTHEPEPPRSLNRGISRDLDVVIRTALEKDRDRRYQTAIAFAEDLGRAEAGEPILARPIGPLVRLARFARRNQGLAASLVALILALAGGLIATLLQKAQSDRNLEDWERLADGVRLDALVREADEDLWPATPDKSSAMERWLGRAQALASRLPDHRAALARLTARGKPVAADTSRSRAPTAVFEDSRLQLQHDRLLELVQGIESLSGDARAPAITITALEARLEFAQTLDRRTLAEPAELWRACLARVRTNRKYASGTLGSPQLGLIPLGPDPGTTLEEFCETATGDLAVRGPDQALQINEGTALVFVLLPGGSFTMGAQAVDELASNFDELAVEYEGPPHEVRLSPFLLSKYEMTQGQWVKVTGANPSNFPPGQQKVQQPITLRNPVEQVSWDDCNLVLGRLGLTFPTEAQWEYACRGGTQSAWWSGKEKPSLALAGNVADRAIVMPGFLEAEEWNDGWTVHAPVGSLAANAFGVHDVHGNVFEWCLDHFGQYPDGVRPGDGFRSAPEARERIYRGGCFFLDARSARCAVRPRMNASTRAQSIGVRPSRSIAP